MFRRLGNLYTNSVDKFVGKLGINQKNVLATTMPLNCLKINQINLNKINELFNINDLRPSENKISKQNKVLQSCVQIAVDSRKIIQFLPTALQ